MKRFTIHVGNNQFQFPGADLRGCVNDARLMDEVLTQRLGEPVERRMLENCTREQFVSAMREAAEAIRSDHCDHLTISLSTHGTVLSSADSSNFVQALVFSDADRSGNGLLIDSGFRDLLDDIPDGRRVEIWLDACHSRTGTRGLGAVMHRMKPRSLPNPEFLRSIHSVRRSVLRSPIPDTVVFSACDDPEEAADALIPEAQRPEDTEDRFHGAFTWYWCQAFRMNPDATRRELCALTTAMLAQNGFQQQHPQLSEQ